MLQRIHRTIVYFTILIFIVISVPACRGCEASDDDEALIRQLVANAVRAAESRDVGGLFDMATESFVGNPGSHDRRSSKAVLMMLFRRYKTFRVVHPAFGVSFNESKTEADIAFPFLIVQEGQSEMGIEEFAMDPARWMEEARKIAEPFYIDAHLVKLDGEWLVATARVAGKRSVGL